jgi:hypothetical protein
MPRRSTRITISNNTELVLTRVDYDADPTHGVWTSYDLVPPSTIPGKTCATWQTESQGVGIGTEAWVKYQISNPDIIGIPAVHCQPELVFIYWDNPFVWKHDTKVIDYEVTTPDVGQYDEPGGDHHPGTNPPGCTHEVFGVSAGGNVPRGITWWDVGPINWAFTLGLTAFGEMDVNLEFTLGLRLKGSVAQTVLATPCVGPQDIRTLSRTLGQPSLRKLFHM